MPQAERSTYSRQLFQAEEVARTTRKRVWENYSEDKKDELEDGEEEEEPQQDSTDLKSTNDQGDNKTTNVPVERKTDYKEVEKTTPVLFVKVCIINVGYSH